jgi:hypothetical protein
VGSSSFSGWLVAFFVEGEKNLDTIMVADRMIQKL